MKVLLSPKKIWAWFRHTLRTLFIQRATPHEIALGAALGIFIGIFPTFGLGGLIVLALAPVIKFNVSAAFIAGSLLSNPFFAPLWIFLSCKIVGIDFSVFKSSDEAEGSIITLLKHYSGVVGMYVAGNAIISSTVALSSYGLTFGLVSIYQKHRKRKEQLLSNN